MFRKLTPFEQHKSFMPFDYLFMTKEQYEEFVSKTKPGDAPITAELKQPTTITDGQDVRDKIDLAPIIQMLNINQKN
jgi:hypothetical protein